MDPNDTTTADANRRLSDPISAALDDIATVIEYDKVHSRHGVYYPGRAKEAQEAAERVIARPWRD